MVGPTGSICKTKRIVETKNPLVNKNSLVFFVEITINTNKTRIIKPQT
jgi:hypothetical protein